MQHVDLSQQQSHPAAEHAVVLPVSTGADAAARDLLSFPVLFEIDQATNEATGTVMPFCSIKCRDTCGGTQYPGFRKSAEGTSRIGEFGFAPQCQQCGGDIGQLLAVQHLPRRGLVGFYRPDPSGPKSPNIVLDVSSEKITVLEQSGLVFKIDCDEWTSRAEMEADTAALPSNPHYIPRSPDDTLLEQVMKERELSLAAADRAQLSVDAALTAYPSTAASQQANG